MSLIVFFHGSAALVCLGVFLVEVSRSQSDTPHSVGFLWTSDRPVADLYLLTHINYTRHISVTSVGFEPAIPTIEWQQTHALDHAATAIHLLFTEYYYKY